LPGQSLTGCFEANEQAKSSRAVRDGSDPMSEPNAEKQHKHGTARPE
jgi:hypothetical protein